MKNKGFTLIELLAVIVILAIIALIATPVILGIIEDARKSTEEQSIELYKKAVENAVANYILKNPSDTNITVDKIKEYIKYDGNKVDCDITINNNKTISLNNCKVNVKDAEDNDETTTLAQHITNLYTPNSTVKNYGITYNIDTTNGIIDDGLGGTQASGGNLRYYGANPDNYIDIGDRDENNNPILWRIIGVFETKYATEEQPCNVDSDSDGHFDNCASDKLVKIIRNDSIGDMAWDENNVNNWNTAPLNAYLNTSTYYPNLDVNVQNKIENTLWNLGGHYEIQYVSINEMYGYERGTARYDTTRPTEWVGKVGLMYPSDYGYATDLTKCSQCLTDYNSSTGSYACRTNDWLYNSSKQWNLNPLTIYPNLVFYVDMQGKVKLSGAYDDFGVRPVLYLKSNVSIVGEGTTSSGINYKIVG